MLATASLQTTLAKRETPTGVRLKKTPTSKTSRANREIVSQLINATKIYGQGETQVRALDDVSLQIFKGEFVAIMGSSGSGKSTLLHCAAGLDRVDSGQVEIAGRNLRHLKDHQLTKLRRQEIGFVFQAYNLIPTLTARENIILPFQITGNWRQKQAVRQMYQGLIKTLGLGDRLHHLPGELSGGQQQRVAVARALVTRPAIIFADEPSGNLDSKSSNDLLKLLSEANRDYKQTIVVVTHSVYVASFTQRVVFVKDGQVVDSLSKPKLETIRQKLDKIDLEN